MTERGFTLTFSYDDTPPSLNAVGARGGGHAFHKQKKRWQKIFEDSLQATGFPRDWETITAVVRLTFPSKQRRDEGNFRVMAEKALGDALVNGRWIPDDTPEHFFLERVHFEQKTGRPRTTVELVAK